MIVAGCVAGGSAADMRALGERALAVFHELGDDVGLAEAYWVVGLAEHNACRWAKQSAALEQVLEHAGRAGNVLLVQRATEVIGAAYVWGARPVDEALAWLTRAIDARDTAIGYLKVEPLWDPLRGDSRFQQQLARINLP